MALLLSLSKWPKYTGFNFLVMPLTSYREGNGALPNPTLILWRLKPSSPPFLTVTKPPYFTYYTRILISEIKYVLIIFSFFLPRCIAALNAARSSQEKAVCLFVCLSIRLSNAWTVTKRKKDLSRFLTIVGGGDTFYLEFWVNLPPFERSRRF